MATCVVPGISPIAGASLEQRTGYSQILRCPRNRSPPKLCQNDPVQVVLGEPEILHCLMPPGGAAAAVQGAHFEQTKRD